MPHPLHFCWRWLYLDSRRLYHRPDLVQWKVPLHVTLRAKYCNCKSMIEQIDDGTRAVYRGEVMAALMKCFVEIRDETSPKIRTLQDRENHR